MRIGIDLGGTKIAAIILDRAGQVVWEHRCGTPQGDYEGTVRALAATVEKADAAIGRRGVVGMGIPGSPLPKTGEIQNGNSTWMNGRRLGHDLETAIGRPVRIANDANCFALSEAIDGAGRDAHSVFGVIIGTGTGGGVVIDRKIVNGPMNIGGEWGHLPLPWPTPDEYPGPLCWCGRRGCMERWVSGPAMTADHERRTGKTLNAQEIAAQAPHDPAAAETLERYIDRLARGLTLIVNVVDPEVVILGGGVSTVDAIYATLADKMTRHIFSARPFVTVKKPVYGDASGVRGAAWLWNEDELPDTSSQ